MKKVFFFICLLILLPTVTAANKTEFSPGEEVNLFIDCIDHAGNACGAGVLCNLSAFYPNETILQSNVIMTSGGDGSYNYSFGALDMTGQYTYNMFCESANQVASITDFFTVSDDYTIGMIIIIITLSFVFTILSFKFEEHTFLQLLFFFIALIFLVLVSSIVNEITTEDYSRLLNIEYLVLLFTTILSFIYFILHFILTAVKSFKFNKEEEYGGEL